MSENVVRRFVGRGLALVAGVAAIGSIAMPAAQAEWDPPTNTYFAQLDVQFPSAGTITSDQVGGHEINCGSDFGSPGPCSIQDLQSVPGSRPTDGWNTYHLMASGGPEGYRWKWIDGCSGYLDVCTIVNSQELTTVSGQWVDAQAPTITDLHLPAFARNPVEVSVDASDNSGSIDHYGYTVCPSEQENCFPVPTNSTSNVFSLTGLADGDYIVAVRAFDANGNGSPTMDGIVTIDSAAPALTVTSPKPGSTQDSFYATVDYTVSDRDLLDVRCSLDGAAAVDCPTGWQTPFLEDGRHTISVQARDVAGNQVIVQRSVTVVDPQVTVVGTARSTYGHTARLQVQAPRNSNGLVEFDDASTGGPLCIKPAGATGKVACTFSGKHFLPGSHDILVRYTGDANHKSVGSTISYLVDKTSSTMTTSARTGQYGKGYTVQVTALPASAGGQVQFAVDTKVLCTATVRKGHASCTVGGYLLDPAVYRAAATYSGDDIHAGTVGYFRLTVAKGAVTLAAAPSAPEVHSGTPVTLTAQGFAANATGTVTFTANGTTLCTATVRKGVASCATASNLALGHYGVLATYSGDAHWVTAKARTSFDVTDTNP